MAAGPLSGYRALRTGWLRTEFQQVRRGRSGREASRGTGGVGAAPGVRETRERGPGDGEARGRGGMELCPAHRVSSSADRLAQGRIPTGSQRSEWPETWERGRGGARGARGGPGRPEPRGRGGMELCPAHRVSSSADRLAQGRIPTGSQRSEWPRGVGTGREARERPREAGRRASGGPGMGRRGEGEARSSTPLTGRRALRTGWLRTGFQQVRRGRSGRRRGHGAGEEGAEARSSALLTGYRALRTGWLRAEFQQVRRGRSGREAWARGRGGAGTPGRAGAGQASGQRDDCHAGRRRCPPEALTPLHFRDLSSNS